MTIFRDDAVIGVEAGIFGWKTLGPCLDTTEKLQLPTSYYGIRRCVSPINRSRYLRKWLNMMEEPQMNISYSVFWPSVCVYSLTKIIVRWFLVGHFGFGLDFAQQSFWLVARPRAPIREAAIGLASRLLRWNQKHLSYRKEMLSACENRN